MNIIMLIIVGHRKNVKKMIFLITDGKQDPRRDHKTGAVLDPVAASQQMIDGGVHIYAVGVGKRVDREQLVNITRDEKKVMFRCR